jgi:bacteriorhodopsin
VKSVFKFLFYSIIIVAILFPIVQILYRLLNGIPIDELLSSLPYVYLGVVIFYVLGFLFIKYVLKS